MMITQNVFLIVGAVAIVLIAAVLPGAAPPASAKPDVLTTALSLDTVTNGVATTHDRRIFLVLTRIDGSSGPRVVEWKPAGSQPYPDAHWNNWAAGRDASQALVRANALRIGPEGDLWIVDVGAPGFGNPKVPHGPKLVQVGLADNAVRRIYSLDGVTTKKSFIDDVRFHGRYAYVSDAGDAALIVLDLETGAAWRALEGHPSVTAQTPMSAEGKTLHSPDGKPVFIQADQLEVSPDGRWLYYQPASGPLSRIETKWLASNISDHERAKHVEPFARTPATGGTAIDAGGNLYVSDTDRQRLLKIAPDGTETTLLQDPRLLWVDAMWLDHEGFLWLPVAQLNRMAPFQNGVSRVNFPVLIYKLQVAAKPPTTDHP